MSAPTEESTPKDGNTMYGKKAICNVCKWQIRPVDEPSDTDCSNDDAQFKSELCSAYEPVSHPALCHRVAELRAMLDIVWDVAMIMLERAEKLPEVPE